VDFKLRICFPKIWFEWERRLRWSELNTRRFNDISSNGKTSF